MDKLAYHLNKKKQPAKTEGKYLYYYPCSEDDLPNVHFGEKPYITIEVTELEWETLFELDRFEYNNEHKLYRHTRRIPDAEEDCLSKKEQERLIGKGTLLSDQLIDEVDSQLLLSKLNSKQYAVYYNCVVLGESQEDVAEELGVTQGYISTVFRKAKEIITEYELKHATPNEYVWKCWELFLDTGEMPNFIDVEIEFVIREMWADILPFLNWYYSLGEFCRYTMLYYLFDEDKIQEDIERFKKSIKENELRSFEKFYSEKLPIIQGVYARLGLEIIRREKNGLHDSDKAFTSFIAAAEKIASRLNMTVYEYLTKRFYPYFAKLRNKRIRQFVKANKKKLSSS